MKISDNFFLKFDIPEDDGCWNWKAALQPNGYGKHIESAGRKNWLAHRLSWTFFNNRKIPEGMLVMHSCDNPRCVNPDHLSLGTYADNNRDKIKKGRDHNLKKTHCPAGHEYDLLNTYLTKQGTRSCVACRNFKSMLCKRRTRAAARKNK